jgi:hypothetical protein
MLLACLHQVVAVSPLLKGLVRWQKATMTAPASTVKGEVWRRQGNKQQKEQREAARTAKAVNAAHD